MENLYKYFKRDISWLSFNYRVLLEAANKSLPIYERINFISIYSSNLEEFYRVRVADYRAVAYGDKEGDDSREEARQIIRDITEEVNKQLEDRIRIYDHSILPELKRNKILFYQTKQEVNPMHFLYPSIFRRRDISIFAARPR